MGIGIQFHGHSAVQMIDELAAGDEKIVHHAFALPERRGRHDIRKIKIFTDAPYGLFFGWYYIRRMSSYVVYPRPVGEVLPVLRHTTKGADFSGLKEYVSGDPVERISWKHSIKRGQLILKEFKEDDDSVEMFSLEICPQTHLEDKLSQLSYGSAKRGAAIGVMVLISTPGRPSW